MITNGYVPLGTLKAELGITDSTDDDRLSAAINAASRQVDAHCGRVFYVDASPTTRTFKAWNAETCYVDDISTVTGLVVEIDDDGDGSYGQTLTIDTDFIVTPINAASMSPIQPFDALEMVDNYYFPTGRRPGVRVTARFGFTQPDDVTTACSLQAKNLYKVTGSGVFGSMQMSPDGIPMRIPGFDYVSRALLEPYRKRVIG